MTTPHDPYGRQDAGPAYGAPIPNYDANGPQDRVPSAPQYRPQGYDSGYGAPTYRVRIGGIERGPYPLEHVRELARRQELSPNDPVSFAGQSWVPATSAPGVFSDKSWLVAVLLSFFLGGLGIDRFYLGYIGLGIAKLLLNWMTFGVWGLIDFILILIRRVPDAQGRPLRP